MAGYLPEGWATDNQIHHLDDLIAWLTDYFELEYQIAMMEYQASLETEEPLPEPQKRTINMSNVMWKPVSAESFKNTPRIPSWETVACYYIDRRELAQAGSPFLNFQTLSGLSRQQLVYVKEQGKLYNGEDPEMKKLRFPSNDEPGIYYTIGVHQRGCGLIRYDDPKAYRSSFNYVAMVQKKVKEATGKELTEDDIYSGQYDAEVQDAVEELIIDEMGLELAFEGTRFSDLCGKAPYRRG